MITTKWLIVLTIFVLAIQIYLVAESDETSNETSLPDTQHTLNDVDNSKTISKSFPVTIFTNGIYDANASLNDNSTLLPKIVSFDDEQITRFIQMDQTQMYLNTTSTPTAHYEINAIDAEDIHDNLEYITKQFGILEEWRTFQKNNANYMIFIEIFIVLLLILMASIIIKVYREHVEHTNQLHETIIQWRGFNVDANPYQNVHLHRNAYPIPYINPFEHEDSDDNTDYSGNLGFPDNQNAYGYLDFADESNDY